MQSRRTKFKSGTQISSQSDMFEKEFFDKNGEKRQITSYNYLFIKMCPFRIQMCKINSRNI